MRKKIFTLLLVAFSACTSLQKTSNIEKNMIKQEIIFLNKKDLIGKEFIIDSNDFKTKITLGFTKDRVYGFSGVNRYFALYKIKNNKLILDTVGVTMMAGSNSATIEEVKFLDLIQDNKNIKLSGNSLILLSNEGIEIKFKDTSTNNQNIINKN